VSIYVLIIEGQFVVMPSNDLPRDGRYNLFSLADYVLHVTLSQDGVAKAEVIKDRWINRDSIGRKDES
jgi:hypothetical protein